MDWRCRSSASVALQIECHPYAQRNDVREKVKPYGIAIECWYPLGHGDKGLLSDPVIAKIAEAHNKSIVQIIIRWHIQEGFSVIPGTTNPDFIKENIDIFDFALSDYEMAAMRSLNQALVDLLKNIAAEKSATPAQIALASPAGEYRLRIGRTDHRGFTKNRDRRLENRSGRREVSSSLFL